MDMQNIEVLLFQIATDGECIWNFYVTADHYSCATFGNVTRINCATGVTGTYLIGGVVFGGSITTGRTCSLSGLSFSGPTVRVVPKCVSNFGVNRRVCNIATIEGCDATTVFGELPEQTTTITWTATIV
jgi:hypothetical protein